MHATHAVRSICAGAAERVCKSVRFHLDNVEYRMQIGKFCRLARGKLEIAVNVDAARLEPIRIPESFCMRDSWNSLHKDIISRDF